VLNGSRQQTQLWIVFCSLRLWVQVEFVDAWQISTALDGCQQLWLPPHATMYSVTVGSSRMAQTGQHLGMQELHCVLDVCAAVDLRTED
jgi:hypothetical protein